MQVHAGTGMSDAVEAVQAGHAAASAAIAELAGQVPALVIVYACIRYDLPALLAAVRSVTGTASLIGATSMGHFARGQFQPSGPGVTVLALTAGPYTFGVASASGISGDLDVAGQQLARESRTAAGGNAEYGAVVLLSDWLLGDQQQLIRGIYRVTGPRIPTVGGAAADMQDFGPTLVFHDDAVLEQGAVALWIASDHPLHVATRHGWEAIGIPSIVSRAEGTDLQELGGRPASAVYLEQLGLPPDALATPEEFFAAGMLHPLAMLQPDESLLIRAVIGKTPSGSLTTIALVPAGSAVQVTTGSSDSLLACVQGVAEDALSNLPEAGVVLAFSCAARAQVYGDRIPEEARLLQDAAGQVPTFGFYTYGEYSRTESVLGTHTATLTAIAL